MKEQIKEKKTGSIYLITNLINNKKYVGQTRNTVSRRWTEHKRDAKNKKNKWHSHLHRSMNKYGIENFTCKTIEENIPIEDLNNREIYWIDFYDTFIDRGQGYNLTTGGSQATTCSQETREKHRYNALQGITGHTHIPREQVYTEEVRKKMSEANKGRKLSPEHREKIAKRLKENPPFKGKHHSEETKEYYRQVFSKANRPPEITEKCVAALKKYYENYPHCFLGKKGKDSSHHKEVFQYDEDFNLVGHFYSRLEVLNYLGIKTHTGLLRAIKTNRTYKGYYWFNEAVETIESNEKSE